MRTPKEQEIEKKKQNLFEETMADNFPNLMKKS